METIRRIDDYLAKLEKVAIAIVLSLMIALSFGQVVLRNTLHQGILWVDIVLRQMVLWVGLLGASLATRDGRHICIELLPMVLPAAWKPIEKKIVNLVSGAVSGILSWTAWKFMQFEKEAESILVLNLPVWIFQIILPAGFFLIALRFIMRVFVDVPADGESLHKTATRGRRE